MGFSPLPCQQAAKAASQSSGRRSLTAAGGRAGGLRRSATIPLSRSVGSRWHCPRVQWIRGTLVEPIWVDPYCGDSKCTSPFEYPLWGNDDNPHGCPFDCEFESKLTNVQIMLDYSDTSAGARPSDPPGVARRHCTQCAQVATGPPKTSVHPRAFGSWSASANLVHPTRKGLQP